MEGVWGGGYWLGGMGWCGKEREGLAVGSEAEDSAYRGRTNARLIQALITELRAGWNWEMFGTSLLGCYLCFRQCWHKSSSCSTDSHKMLRIHNVITTSQTARVFAS